jgi:hypothetical protein
MLVGSGAAFVEVPPQTPDHDFICCLTHDIDFHGIRRHRFDRTLAGFIGRASFGTVADWLRGRRPFGDAARNWLALLSLPAVFAGLMPDFWRPFEQYEDADRARPSTFFVVPFRNRAGVNAQGVIDSRRAVKYEAGQIRAELERAADRGSEIAVHGIDAWRDSDLGRAEIAQFNCDGVCGVRMHWLYFSADSPRHLEAAGFAYDSTCGYNEAIGYRAGTGQVFRLLGTTELMELPLVIMDSALFFHGRMNLAPEVALAQCHAVLKSARDFGGTVVINWHDRSLAPERLWDGFYGELLEAVEDGAQPWFATAREAVQWFRWRRSIRLERVPGTTGEVTIRAPRPSPVVAQGLVRVYRSSGPGTAVQELSFGGTDVLRVSL